MSAGSLYYEQQRAEQAESMFARVRRAEQAGTTLLSNAHAMHARTRTPPHAFSSLHRCATAGWATRTVRPCALSTTSVRSTTSASASRCERWPSRGRTRVHMLPLITHSPAHKSSPRTHALARSLTSSANLISKRSSQIHILYLSACYQFLLCTAPIPSHILRSLLSTAPRLLRASRCCALVGSRTHLRTCDSNLREQRRKRRGRGKGRKG